MKKKNGEFLRIADLIKSDRSQISDEFISLVRADVKRTLKEYFEDLGGVKVDILVEDNGYNFKIEGRAKRLSAVGTIPR